MTNINQNLARNIRRLRESHSMSQQRISEISGIPRPTWASLETGTANPTLAVLSKAATALKVSIGSTAAARQSAGLSVCWNACVTKGT